MISSPTNVKERESESNDSVFFRIKMTFREGRQGRTEWHKSCVRRDASCPTFEVVIYLSTWHEHGLCYFHSQKSYTHHCKGVCPALDSCCHNKDRLRRQGRRKLYIHVWSDACPTGQFEQWLLLLLSVFKRHPFVVTLSLSLPASILPTNCDPIKQ